jgi:hypothetical protein
LVCGAYAFGRHRWRKQPDGRVRRERVPREQSHALLRDAHPGYISWEEHERIEQRLHAGVRASAHRDQPDRRIVITRIGRS